MAKTSVKDDFTLKEYTAKHSYVDSEDNGGSGLDVVQYSGPFDGPVSGIMVRTYNAYDRLTILQALNCAYEAGKRDQRQAIMSALGLWSSGGHVRSIDG